MLFSCHDFIYKQKKLYEGICQYICCNIYIYCESFSRIFFTAVFMLIIYKYVINTDYRDVINNRRAFILLIDILHFIAYTVYVLHKTLHFCFKELQD